MRIRVAVSVAGLLAVAGALNYLVVEHAAPGAGKQTLLVDLFAGMATMMLTIWLTARYEAGIRRIASGLSEVARGRRDLRFDVGREPLVANLAHAANEAIGSMAEPVDPAIGAVRVRKRVTGEMRVMSNPSSDDNSSQVGTPRPMQSAPDLPAPAPAVVSNPPRLTPVPPAAESAPAVEAPAAPTPPPPPAASAPPAPSEPALPPMPDAGATLPPEHISEKPHRASQVPTVLPPASAEPVSTPAKGTPISDAQQRQEHFKSIFEEYRASLARLGEPDEDLTIDGFQDTLSSAERALMDKHGCRSVRFSVLVEDGRVQLLPRLVR